MQSIGKRLSSDEGLGLLEIMIAATILFIVLTGVLGMVLQSTSMGLQSKQNVVLNNVVSSYFERVQALTFDKVDLVGVGDGVLSTETTTVGGFTVVIVPQEVVTNAGVSGLKTLTVAATLSKGGAEVQDLATSLIIRDKDRFLTEGLNPPVVSWGLGMPAMDGVVWGTLSESGSLFVRANIKAAGGKTIRSIRISADGLVLQNTMGDEAYWEWEIGEQPTQESVNFLWNTEQERAGETSGTLVPAIPDGRRTIVIVALDSAGADRAQSYTLIVDNNPPGTPVAEAIAAAAGPALTTFTWGTASDGTDLAYGYQLYARKQATDGTWSDVPGIPPASAVTQDVPTGPFSRYWAEVGAVGMPPNSRVSAARAGMSVSWITPPRALGTALVVKAGNNFATSVNLAVTPPQFPVVGVPAYAWEYASAETGPWTQFATGPTALHGPIAATGAGAKRYYRCRVTFQPGVDYDGSTLPPSTTITSTVVGPTPAGAGIQTLTDRWLP